MKKLISRPLLLVCLAIFGSSAFSQIPTSWGNQTIPAGSKIIDMGVTSQTVANGLKPYGLVYDLVKNYNVPVLWAINPNKVKDGADFTQDGVTYYGGPFIIKAGYLTSSVNTDIASWTSQGVIVRTTTTSGSIPIFKEINQAPVWVISTDNTTIPTAFLTDGGIPSSAYSSKAASALTICDNIFAMPHSDPTWATHSRLFSWVKSLDSTNGCQGWLWGGCHAVSVMENLSNASIPWQKMNFLSTNGLVPYGSHSKGSAPFINDSFPSNPLMQYMSTIDAATNNGSEEVYLPALSSAWRSKTKLGVWDPTQTDIPSLSPGKAAIMIWGPAFDDYNAGYVAYEAGHDVSGTHTYNIAAERLFFNFSFLAPLMQTRTFNIDSYTIPDTIYTGNTQTLSVSVSGTTGPFTYQWSSTCAGAAFSASTSATTNLTIPPNTGTCIVKVVVTSSCTKISFSSKSVTLLNVGVLPLQLLKYKINYADNKAKLSWEVNNDADGRSYLIERSLDGFNFSEVGAVAVDPSNHGLYNFDDATVNGMQNGIFYYRIRLLTKDSRNKLSPILILRRGSGNITLPTIKPNPAKSYITLSLFAKNPVLANLSLINVDGKTVLSNKISLISGENDILLNELDKFPAGMYSAVIKTDTESVAERFFILN